MNRPNINGFYGQGGQTCQQLTKICERCGKKFTTIARNKGNYCGDRALGAGCTYQVWLEQRRKAWADKKAKETKTV